MQTPVVCNARKSLDLQLTVEENHVIATLGCCLCVLYPKAVDLPLVGNEPSEQYESRITR